MTRLFASFLALWLLTACAGSPMGVEYRAPQAIDPARQTLDDQIRQQRIVERSKGGEI